MASFTEIHISIKSCSGNKDPQPVKLEDKSVGQEEMLDYNII